MKKMLGMICIICLAKPTIGNAYTVQVESGVPLEMHIHAHIQESLDVDNCLNYPNGTGCDDVFLIVGGVAVCDQQTLQCDMIGGEDMSIQDYEKQYGNPLTQ